jgi:coenzyme F420 hydrogenase subunit beta
LAKTPEAIIEAKGSKYSPVTFDRIVRTLRAMDPSRDRVAVVGLPCHIEGMFQAMQVSERRMQRIVKYQIGLVCGQSPSQRSYDYILHRLRIDPRDVRQLTNRGDGWPGSMTITGKDGSSVKVPYQSALSMGMVLSSPIFTPTACQLCADPVGFRADATVSDAWLERFAGDSSGTSLVLVRNAELGEVLRSMARQGKLVLSNSSAEEFLHANKDVMEHKALNRPIGLRWLLGDRASQYNQLMRADLRRQSWWKRLKLFFFFQHIRLVRRWNLRTAQRWLNAPILFYFKAVNLLKR